MGKKLAPIDTDNKQLVGRHGDAIFFMRPPVRMSIQEALTMAAWIVAIACDDEQWNKTHDAVMKN
jgi:hypothetical protein